MPDAPNKQDEKPTIAPIDSKVVKIPGVKLSVAIGKEVVVRIQGVEQSYKGKIVGYDPYDYLIAHVRLPSKVRKELKFGGEIIIKYIHKGTVYGFKSTVHNVISSPTSLVFFDYPDVIEKIELRRESRVKVNIDGALHTLDGEHDCLILNVSETGCKLSARAGTRDPISATKVDDTLVAVMNFGAEGTLKLPIVARTIRREKGIMTMGAMFIDINKKEEETIRRYLERVQRLTR